MDTYHLAAVSKYPSSLGAIQDWKEAQSYPP